MDNCIYPPTTIDFLQLLSFICDVLQIEGGFFVLVKINELIDDFKIY